MTRMSRIVLAVTALSALALSACADPGAETGSSGDGSGQTAIGGSGPDDPTSSGGEPGASGSEPGASGSEPGASGSVPPGSEPTADLTVSVSDGNGAVITSMLTCAPPGGDHPDPAAACAALAVAGTDVFSPPDPDLACTEIYGGPQTASITGTVGGTRVNATFSRKNGCEIARWDALGPILGSAGAN